MILQPPYTDFKSGIIVVGGYIEVNGRLLYLHRSSHKAHGDKWATAGGKIEPGETLEEAFIREVREETGIIITSADLRYLATYRVRHAKDFVYHTFHVQLPIEPLVTLNEEHQDARWVTPVDAFALDLMDDEDHCLRHFLELTQA